MKGSTFYRIATVLLLLFAAGHTVGFLSFKPPTAEGLAVRDAMMDVHFQVKNADLSYGGFYKAFGLSITVNLLFSAFLAWHLAKHPAPMVAWALCAVQIVGVALGLIYFTAVQAGLAGLVAACLAYGAWSNQANISR